MLWVTRVSFHAIVDFKFAIIFINIQKVVCVANWAFILESWRTRFGRCAKFDISDTLDRIIRVLDVIVRNTARTRQNTRRVNCVTKIGFEMTTWVARIEIEIAGTLSAGVVGVIIAVKQRSNASSVISGAWEIIFDITGSASWSGDSAYTLTMIDFGKTVKETFVSIKITLTNRTLTCIVSNWLTSRSDFMTNFVCVICSDQKVSALAAGASGGTRGVLDILTELNSLYACVITGY